MTGPTDPARGLAADHSLHRDPVAVLAAVMVKDDGRDARSALAIATESAANAATTRTAGELFADAAALAATERTGRWLDRLAAEGVITGDDRSRLAAEDGAASLTRVLRRAEIAGKDAERVLREAVTDRPLDGSRNLTNVIHARIRDVHIFDPQGETWREWTPATGRSDWDQYLERLADAADQRTAELAEKLAEAPPPWLTQALGPVPDQAQEREEWLDAAGTVANWRELQGYDDPDDALGSAPTPGKVEAYASYRAAWQALGRPDIDREELELSDGQLRVRVRAHEREAAWAPRYVANELAGTNQAAERARQDAELRRAEAQAADEAEQVRLREAADAAKALAGTLTARASELAELDDARSRWLSHTARTRAAAERAKAELAARHADDTAPELEVTAREWLTAHRQAVAEDEAHREVTDADVTDRPADIDDEDMGQAERPQAEASGIFDDEPATDEQQGAHVQPGPDIRETADVEPAQVAEDNIRVPTADETSAAIERANRALVEMRSREEMDAREEEQHRADQLAEWQVRDETDDHSDETGIDEGADHDDVDAFDQVEE
jgi:hypothetical protein